MSDKLEALEEAALAATPGPWYRSSVIFNGVTSEQTFITQGNKPHIANAGEKRDAIFIAAASPDVVLSLLAALEEKDQIIAELNVKLFDQSILLDAAISRAEATERREEHLKASVDVLSAKNAELEQRLQQPIKLTQRYETAGYCIDEHYCQEADDGDYLDRDELIASLREQGYQVEGE